MMYRYNFNKYGNTKIKAGDEIFDSKKEAKRYEELRWLEMAGKITKLQRQVKFELIPKQIDEDGKVIERACDYIADFVYYDMTDGLVVEDTKGFKTKDYIIKRKLMLYIYKIRIKEA